MISVKKQIRYNVVDESCPSALFDAKDISIQQVAMDTKGKEKEWVAIPPKMVFLILGTQRRHIVQ